MFDLYTIENHCTRTYLQLLMYYILDFVDLAKLAGRNEVRIL